MLDSQVEGRQRTRRHMVGDRVGGVDEDAVALRTHEEGDVLVGFFGACAERILVAAIEALPGLIEACELLAKAVDRFARRPGECLIAGMHCVAVGRVAQRQAAVAEVGIQVAHVFGQ